MSMKFPIVTLALLLPIAACTSPMEQAAASRLAPPMIGSPHDDLRLGPPPPASPAEVRFASSAENARTERIGHLRAASLQEAASSYGSQMGYARRAWEIASRLETRSTDLSTVFDFNRVVSTAPARAGVVIPPVVSRAHHAYISTDGGRSASVADEYLQIVAPGRLAPVAPTWRDYLLIVSGSANEPDRSMMPSNSAEQAAFREFFDAGWQAGVEMADAEFEERMNRLRRDYTGMLQYRRLVAQGMMDRMVLANADFGVTTEGNAMRIGSRTVEVVSDAQFQGNPQRWSLRSVSERDALIVATGTIPPIE